MRILVTGAGGLVGRATLQAACARGDEAIGLAHAQLDIADEAQVARALDEHRPDWIINCAAWTDVDANELDPQRSRAIHALGPELLARHARRHRTGLVTISTDYVFDGAETGFYTQRDDPNPQSVYAQAKVEGERRAMAASARCIVVRSGWIFGAGGRNFLSVVLGKLRAGEPVKALSDAWGTPTSARDLAERMLLLAQLDLPGIFHVANEGGPSTFADFAQEAASLAGLPRAIPTVRWDDLTRRAPRPRSSPLRCVLSPALGLAPLPDWQASLADAVRAGEL